MEHSAQVRALVYQRLKLDMRFCSIHVVLMFLTGTVPLGFAQIGKQSADESEIRKSDAAWSHAAESKELDKFVSFYADDASALHAS